MTPVEVEGGAALAVEAAADVGGRKTNIRTGGGGTSFAGGTGGDTHCCGQHVGGSRSVRGTSSRDLATFF